MLEHNVAVEMDSQEGEFPTPADVPFPEEEESPSPLLAEEAISTSSIQTDPRYF